MFRGYCSIVRPAVKYVQMPRLTISYFQQLLEIQRAGQRPPDLHGAAYPGAAYHGENHKNTRFYGNAKYFIDYQRFISGVSRELILGRAVGGPTVP